MRFLILSDVHGNDPALAAVLAAEEGRACEEVVLLGDLVGYGADPNRVIERLRGLDRPLHAVRGNHDRLAAGLDDGVAFNEVARAAGLWTRERLTAENRRWLLALAAGPRRLDGVLAYCHGSPADEDDYLFSRADASSALAAATEAVTFFGHTHVACAFRAGAGEIELLVPSASGDHLDLAPGARHLVNPGSVGQPRDHDPRAAFLVYDRDSGRVTWHRTDYDRARARSRILEAGLPPMLAERLEWGV